MPEFPVNTALLGVAGAIAAVIIKVLLGRKPRPDNAPLVPRPPPSSEKVHEAASKVVVESFEDSNDKIKEANDSESEEDRLKRLSDLANLAKRR